MVLNTKIYAKIGRQVVAKHPELASAIISGLPKPLEKDLSKILDYIDAFIIWSGTPQQMIVGAIYQPHLTEQRKVFICAMVRLYADRHLFQKRLTQVLHMHHSAVSDVVAEVKVRFLKDISFTEKVNAFLSQIINQKPTTYES